MNNILSLQVLGLSTLLDPCVSEVSCDSHQSCVSGQSSVKPAT